MAEQPFLGGFINNPNTPKTPNYALLGNPFITAVANNTKKTGGKVTLDTVLKYVFEYGGSAVAILSQIGVIKNKNLAAMQEIAQRGYNQNDVQALAGQLDLSALQKEVDKRNTNDAKDNTLLYVGLAFVALVAIYLITKQNDTKQFEPVSYQQYRKR